MRRATFLNTVQNPPENRRVTESGNVHDGIDAESKNSSHQRTNESNAERNACIAPYGIYHIPYMRKFDMEPRITTYYQPLYNMSAANKYICHGKEYKSDNCETDRPHTHIEFHIFPLSH